MLHEIVKETLSKINGGTKYFDLLDDKIKYNEKIIIGLLSHIHNLKNKMLVLSGEIAYQIKKYCDDNLPMQRYMIICGSPRRNQDIYIDYENSKLNYSFEPVFVDDSFYSGKTFFEIRNFLKKELAISLETCFVAYDGSQIKYKYVYSLFRYYDYFNEKGIQIKEF